MIEHARGPRNHAPSDLNFEVNLRTWKVDRTGVPNQEQAFKYPKNDEKVDSVQVFKGQFKPLKGRKLELEYRETYPDKNFNNVRCFKT